MIHESSLLSKLIEESDFDKYLLPFLSPTSPGTKFFESPPTGKLNNRQFGRICLQTHQLVERLIKLNIDKDITFIDIGTGNGFIPKLLPYFINLKYSHGCDPYLEEGHQTSFQKHNKEKEFEKIIKLIKEASAKTNLLKFNDYSSMIGYEHFASFPLPIPLSIEENQTKNKYRFFQIGAHNLEQLDCKYNFLYCKAIEHIPDWPKLFEQAYITSSEKAFFYLKHKSFFSYLGAHRYGSTGVPWGHLRLNDNEYNSYVEHVQPERAKMMKNFFYNDLAYPRHTVGEMIKIASSKGWKLSSVEYEKSKNTESFQKFLFTDNCLIYNQIKNNYDVSIEELLSGLIHLIFTK